MSGPDRPKCVNLAEVRPDLFVVLKHGHLHIAQTEPHERRAAARRHQWHERAVRRHDGVPRLPGETVAVAGRTGLRIGHAARGDDHAVRRQQPPARAHAGHPAVRQLERRGGLVYDFNTRVFDPSKKRVNNVRRPVRNRKHAASPLGLERHAVRLKKRHHIRRAEAAQRGIQKARVDRHVLQHLLRVTVVAHVAAALARDEQLAADFFIFLQQRHMRAGLRRRARGHQPGRAAADHNDVQLMSSSGFS